MKNHNRLPSNFTLEQTFRHSLLRELKSIKQWQKVAIKGQDPEGVHQVRISLRRIRTALLIFKPVINTKFSQRIAKKFKKYAKLLDDARDMDVYILTHFTDNTDSTVKTSALTKRDEAYKNVKKCLKSKPFNKRIHACKKWLKTGHWQKKIIKDKKLNHALNSFAFDTLDTLMNLIVSKGQQPEKLDDLALHKLRIDCKKLRYSTEFFISLYDKNTVNSFIEKLKRLQDSLGDIHDAFIQKQLHQKLLQQDKKIHQTTESQEILLTIERKSEIKKQQLIDELTAFCQTEYPWRT